MTEASPIPGRADGAQPDAQRPAQPALPGPAQPPPSSEALGAAVRRLRQDRGLKQRELSAASSVNTSYLSGIERGHRNPTWVSLGRICSALDVRVSELARLAEDLAGGYGSPPQPSFTPGTVGGPSEVATTGRNVWTVPLDDGGWGNRYEESNRVLDKGPRKADVEKQGRDRARKERSEHVVQKKDGSIHKKNSYGHDPRSTPG